MSTRFLVPTLLGVAVAWTTMSASVAAQDQFAAAKDLYASAAYEDALSALTLAHNDASADTEHIDQYRAFCLFALGRTSEAEAIADTLVRKDPLLKLDAPDVSPRIEAMFGQVKKRLLPGLIREGYRSARGSMETGQTVSAADQFRKVRLMLDNAKALDVWDDALGDVSLLVDGFIGLTRARERPTDAEPAPRTPVPGPAIAAAAEAAVPPPVTAPHVYTALDADVKAPVPIHQQVPAVPTGVYTTMRNANRTGGILEITIDEEGRVTDARMRDPANPMFDSIMVAAAKTWRYHPATRSGKPVPYVKRIAVTVTPTESRD
jgi:TonB family protein